MVKIKGQNVGGDKPRHVQGPRFNTPKILKANFKGQIFKGIKHATKINVKIDWQKTLLDGWGAHIGQKDLKCVVIKIYFLNFFK